MVSGSSPFQEPIGWSQASASASPVLGNITNVGALAPVLIGLSSSPTAWVGVISLVVIAILARRLDNPRMDSREPPLVKSKIPIVGHLLPFLRHQNMYFKAVYDSTPDSPSAVTITLVGQKTVAIFSPAMAQAAMRNKNLTQDFLVTANAPNMFGISPNVLENMLGRDGIHDNVLDSFNSNHGSLLTGKGLARVNAVALGHVAGSLNAIQGPGLRVPSLYLWIRDRATHAILAALYGDHNPFEEQSLRDDLWTWDKHMGALLVGRFPKIIARKPFYARARITAALLAFHKADIDTTDPSVSDFVSKRGELMRTRDLTVEEWLPANIGTSLVSTSSTVPTLFWLVVNIFLRPSLLAECRAEAAAMLTATGQLDADGHPRGEVGVDTSRLETDCPLLLGCYREVVRLYNQTVVSRRAAQSCELRDEHGRAFLLREGVDVFIPASVLHRRMDVWAADADEFDPRRFTAGRATAEEERARKMAYIPFGGGKHLCPGRNFAFAEILGSAFALLTGFELHGLKEENVKMAGARLAEAVARPTWDGEGGEVVVARREGWEGVVWRFFC